MRRRHTCAPAPRGVGWGSKERASDRGTDRGWRASWGAARATVLEMVSVLVRIALALVPIAALACRRETAPTPAPPSASGQELQIVGESTRLRLEDPWPAASPWFDGARVTLVAARGETIGIQILQRPAAAVSLEISGPGLAIRGYAVESFEVSRPSTAMYGGSHGAGTYADGLVVPASPSPATNPAYFEIEVARDAPPGARSGKLVVGGRPYPVELTIAPVTLRPLARRACGPTRIRASWCGRRTTRRETPRRSISRGRRRRSAPASAMFRAHGVLLSPDLQLDWWPHRREMVAGASHIPVTIPDDPAEAGEAVRGWIAATRGTGQIPFAIPIDEPHGPRALAKVRALVRRRPRRRRWPGPLPVRGHRRAAVRVRRRDRPLHRPARRAPRR